MSSQAPLPEIIQADSSLYFLSGLGDSCEAKCCKNGDDRHHRQKFQQRKALIVPSVLDPSEHDIVSFSCYQVRCNKNEWVKIEFVKKKRDAQGVPFHGKGCFLLTNHWSFWSVSLIASKLGKSLGVGVCSAY